MQPIKMGASGSAVLFLQQRLNAKGFSVDEDGAFGPQTDRAVRQFQASCNLVVDGWVGDKTWAHLLAEGVVRTPERVVDEQIEDLSATARRAVGLSTLPMQSERLAVLLAGISELGKQEQPVGSNGGPEIAHIVEPMGGDGLMPSDYAAHWSWADAPSKLPPWCGIFVSYCLLTGLEARGWSEIPFGDWFGGAQQIEDWGKARGTFHRATADRPAPAGTIFSMGRGGSGSDSGGATARAGHVGLVVVDDGTHVVTIEGNVSNGVRSYRRKKDSLRGFIDWW